MIGDSVDFFQGQISSKIYLHSLLVAIWDIIYKAGRLFEESINHVSVDQSAPNPLLERPETLVDMLKVNLKQVKFLMPEPLLLEYMKRQEKLVSGVLLPLRTELDAASFQNQQEWMQMMKNLSLYPQDVGLVHTLCDVVQNMEKDRLQRNLSKVQSDLSGVIGQANAREEIILKSKSNYENSIIELRKIVKKVAWVLKESQLNSTAKDLDMLTQSDAILAEIFAKLSFGVKDITNRLEDKIQDAQDCTHRELIQAEYNKRQTNKLYALDANWKPFLPQIQTYESTRDKSVIPRLVQSFQVLFDSIEWTFQEEFIPDPSLEILDNLRRMEEFILAKSQELEYAKVRADDASHSVTQEFIRFWERLFEQITATLAEVFYEHPHYRVATEQLRLRAQFGGELQDSFAAVKRKFANHEGEYLVPEYWKELSSICFDFTERVYTKYNPQKIKLLQAVKGVLGDFRLKLEYMVKEIQTFHQKEFEQTRSITTNYRRQLVEWYNTLIISLKQQHGSVKLKDGYQIKFVKNVLEVNFNPEVLESEEQGVPERTSFALPLNIPPPPILGTKTWELNTTVTVPDEVKKALTKPLDQKYGCFSKNPNIVWTKLHSAEMGELSLHEYLNLVVRDRTLKVEGKFYKSFNAVMQQSLSENVISFEPFDPPIEPELLGRGYGTAESKVIKEKPMKISIPFFPPTYQSENEANLLIMGGTVIQILQKSVSRGIPGSDSFYVLTAVEAISKQKDYKAKGIVIDMFYSLVFTSSTMLEGTIRDNVPKEVTHAFKKFESNLGKVIRENEAENVASDPTERLETNNPFARKLENSGILQSLPDRSGEIFAPPVSAKQREQIEKANRRRRYLGEYDRRAVYHSGPEASNPEFEDIFVVSKQAQTTTDKVLAYFKQLQERNLGAVDEITAKQQEFVSLFKEDPKGMLEQSKSFLLADWRRTGKTSIVPQFPFCLLFIF